MYYPYVVTSCYPTTRFKYKSALFFDVKGGDQDMGKIIVKNAVQRRPGHLYYIDGQGNICEAVMSRGGRKKKKR